MQQLKSTRRIAARRAEPTPKRQRGAPRLTHRTLTPAAELDLVRRYQAGDNAAAEVLLRVHEPLLMRIVKTYLHRGLHKDDLLQCARIGMCTGIKRFEEGHKTKLMSYASWHVREEIASAIAATSKTIRLSSDAWGRCSKVKTGKAPETEETCAWMRLVKTSSLDKPVGLHGTPRIELQASDAADPEAMLAAADSKARRRKIIDAAMRGACLSDFEREIVERRYLAHDGPNLWEIARERGLSRERVRQIEAKAMWKLARSLRLMARGEDAEILRGAA